MPDQSESAGGWSARTATAVWAALVCLTILTWLLARGTFDGRAVGALIALAGIKMYLILSVFMGLWRAPPRWHIAAIVWVVALMAGIGALAGLA